MPLFHNKLVRIDLLGRIEEKTKVLFSLPPIICRFIVLFAFRLVHYQFQAESRIVQLLTVSTSEILRKRIDTSLIELQDTTMLQNRSNKQEMMLSQVPIAQPKMVLQKQIGQAKPNTYFDICTSVFVSTVAPTRGFQKFHRLAKSESQRNDKQVHPPKGGARG